VFVHGNSLKSSIVGIVVPDPDVAVSWCASKGITGSYEEICASPEAKGVILEDMHAIGKKRGLKTFELVKTSCYCDML